MKQFFTLLTSLLLGLSLLAADKYPSRSTLMIQSADRNSSMRVIIDGRRFEPADNYMRIQGMDAGLHQVKIYKEKTVGLFFILGKKYEVVFNSSIAIRPHSNVMISIDRFGRATVTNSRGRRGWFDQENRGFGDRDGRTLDDGTWDRNHDFDYDRGNRLGDYDNGHEGRYDGRDGRGYDNEGRYDGRDGRGYDNGYTNRAMSDVEFSRVLSSIDKEWFENNKMKSAQQIVNTNFFTAAQVKQMLQLFRFENNKLELAELAYSKTVDQRNYSMINDVFAYDSSVDELARYIRSH